MTVPERTGSRTTSAGAQEASLTREASSGSADVGEEGCAGVGGEGEEDNSGAGSGARSGAGGGDGPSELGLSAGGAAGAIPSSARRRSRQRVARSSSGLRSMRRRK